MTAFDVYSVVQVVMWYFFSAMYNIEIKKILLKYDLPWTASLLSAAVACVGCAALMSKEKERVSRNDSENVAHTKSPTIPFNKLIVIGLLQFVFNIATNLSIQAMSVSFTQVVLATEVFFVIMWSYILTRYGVISRIASITGAHIALILVVTAGVILASTSEVTFLWHGLIFVILANIASSGRNVFVKRVMSDHEISKERLFVIASFISCVPSIFTVMMFELPVLATVPWHILLALFHTSIVFSLYNAISFSVLEGVSLFTYSAANCIKSLCIVVVSIIILKTHVTPLNIFGSLVAIFGTALYSQLGAEHSLGKLIRKNLVFILVGSLVVTGVLLIPHDNYTSLESDSSAAECPVLATLPPPAPLPVIKFPFMPKRAGNSELIKHLQAEIVSRLGPSFKKYKKVVMLDVPNHSNKGDSAIFTGEDAFLRLMNVELIYACSDGGWRTGCNITKVIEMADPKDTLIALHGGGNFGDLWPWVVETRNKYIADLLDSKKEYDFIMLPQTITFREKKNIEVVQKLYGRIKNLVFTVRDIPSMNFMKQHFPNTPTIYMPDMAWLNGHKEISKAPEYDILFFLRTDHEGEKLADRVKSKISKASPSLKYKIDDWTKTDVVNGYPLVELNHDRFYAGLDFLTQAKVVVTNRLHGHILSTLLDLPHVIVDNIYGKVFDNHKAWTLNATGVEMATNIEEATDKALAMLEEIRQHNEE